MRFLELIRWNHWGESKLPFALWAAAAGFGSGGETDLPGFFLVGGYTLFLLAFGFLYNDYCDIDHDERAGKVTGMVRLQPAMRYLSILTALGCAGGIALLAGGGSAIWMAGGLLLAAFYSGGGLRLKGKGAAGIMSAAIAQWSVPVLVAAQRFHAWKDLWSLAVIGCLVGCRYMLIHQDVDMEADRLSGQVTFGTQVGKKSIEMGIRYLLSAEIFIVFCSLLGLALTGRLVLAVLLSLSFVVSIGAKTLSIGPWDQDFSHVSLASFYLILAPLVTYPFIPGLGLALMVLHALLVRKFLVGEIFRCWYSQHDGEI